jgi:hypothetical protein
MSDVLISIDPGVSVCGVAIFWVGTQELYAAALIQGISDARVPFADRIEALAYDAQTWVGAKLKGENYSRTVAVEIPQVYEAARQKGDQNDLISVAFSAGAVARAVTCSFYTGSGPLSVSYKPREWKGTIDADTMTARIESRLTDYERRKIEKCAASLRHNVIDAVGIGLHYLGRLNRKRVIAR